MKKNGFTLAEVLITLAIIGVIATMTLPALIANTSEQQARATLKKAINTFTNAAEMHQATTGLDYATLTSDNIGTAGENGEEPTELPSLYAILANRTQIDFGKSLNAAPTTQLSNGASPAGTIITFRDGTSLFYTAADTHMTTGQADGTPVSTPEADNLPHGFTVIFDTNGAKGPNIVSNCQTTPAGAASPNGDDNGARPIGAGADAAVVNVNTQCSNAQRVIKDQFLLQFRGTTVQPRGAAAQWLLED